MKITFLGGAREVTGSSTLLETGNKKILIDCGLEQGADTYENAEIPVKASEIDFMFLTHAHIDHSGKIPMLTKQGFKGKVYTTAATKRLCSIMLMDSAHIQEQEADWCNKKAKRQGLPEYEPLYTQKDVQALIADIDGCSYNKEYEICPEIKFRLIDAGHLLGSASVELTLKENEEEKVLLFSGDIGNIDRPLIRDPQKPAKADYVVIESTYSDRTHGPRKDYEAQLTKIIQETLDRGGNLVIPAFAVGRTQEFLYLIHCIKQKGLINGHPDFPVWVDSPLAIEATKIYDGSLMDYYDEETLRLINNGEDILDFKGINFSVTAEESKQINLDTTPKVIISSSGMCEAGRIRHHLKHNLWREESTVLFVGYQSAGTLGRIILDGAREVKLFGEPITVKAHVEQMDGISGHGDKEILLDWLKVLKPQRVFVNHGEEESAENFAKEIKEILGFEAIAPYTGQAFDLISNQSISEGNRKPLEKKSKVSPAYEKLLKAQNKLFEIINSLKGGSDKEIEAVTEQINSIINKH